uniref:ras-related protein Rab-17 n=1 Tax=Myodes glareolus TaxID=447135 RepID=UPI00202250F8|nr:ras-related protein Rab-17 [Myodes glareolus]
MAQAGGLPQASTTSGQPYVSKLVLLGSSSVGKTSLVLRYIKQDFNSVLPTVGCAFFTKVLDVGSSSLKLEIWDTAGQEKYHSVCHLYFRGANAALLVYDITRKEGKEFAESKSLLFMETSVKQNYQVSEVFDTIAQELLKRAGDRGSSSPQDGEAVVLNQGPAARQRQCCA